MQEVKLLSLSKYENKSKCEELSNNNAGFNDNSTKNLKIKKETHELRLKSLSDKNCNTEETKNQIQGFYINSAGYGMIPKLVMQDRNLSVTSKAIYAYFCSYTGAGNTCFPSYKKICYDLNIHEETFIRHFKPLVHFGYVQVRQIRDKVSGRFSHNEYILQEILPHPVFSEKSSENVENKPFSPNPELPCTVKPGTKIKSIKINNNKINKYIRAKACASVPIEQKNKKCANNKCANAQPLIENKNTEPLLASKNIALRKSKPKLAPKVLEEEFDTVWDLYPKKKDKTRAFKAFSKARKEGVPLEKIREGVQKYVQEIENTGIAHQYIKYGSTWFNNRCWEDEYDTNTKSSYDLNEYVKAMDTFENKSEDNEKFVDEKELEEERRKDLLFEGYEEIAPGVFYDKIFQRTEFLNEESRIAYEKNSGDSP